MSPVSTATDTTTLPAIAGGTPVLDAAHRLIFQAPIITEAEIDSVTACLRSRWVGLGPRVAEFERRFAEYKGAPYAAAVSSCSAALHLSLMALGIGPGDEVIAPTMTYCATVHAILHVGATPVLVDCDTATCNTTADRILQKITPRTRAVIVVHIAGRPCEMPPIVEICRAHNLRLIEDCAHAIETTSNGLHAGLWGDTGCFSFYPTKNITTGDGGMVITANRRLFRRIKLLSQNGMSADAWARESRRKRTHILAPGYKYNMTDIEASIGLVQLAAVEDRRCVRERVTAMYCSRLQHPAIELPAAHIPGDRSAYHLFSINLRLDRLAVTRDHIVDAMHAENVGTGIHYVPVHQQPFYRRRYRLRDADFPNASCIGQSTLSLPLSADLDEAHVDAVCVALLKILDYFLIKDTGCHS